MELDQEEKNKEKEMNDIGEKILKKQQIGENTES